MGNAGKHNHDAPPQANGSAGTGAAFQGQWSIKPAPQALLDAPLDFILADHIRRRQASKLLMMIAGGEFDRRGVAELTAFLEGDFALHFGDVEFCFFPMLRQHCAPEDDINVLIERLSVEHRQAESAIEEVVGFLKELLAGKELSKDGARRIRAFARHVRQHLAFENSVLLPIARVRLNAESLKTLSRKLKERHNIKDDVS